MYTLQELIEKGIVNKIETDETHLGDGYTIYVHLHSASIFSVTIEVGIDETLDDAIILINKMVEVDNELRSRPKRTAEHTVRKATSEELKELLSGAEIKETKISPEDYAE